MAGKVRMGMVGGGEGAFIGAVHRMAAALDGQIELVCGAFSADPAKSRRSGAALLIDESRVYPDYATMMVDEAALPETERMEFVAIVTPNNTHFPIAKASLEAGFHVLSDKPATLTLVEAQQLSALSTATGLHYGLTHTYAGYPMVKEAKARIAAGDLGRVRKVMVEYSQGWLADQQEHQDNKQAAWRLDPAQAGVSSAMGDIGVHAAHLAEYISGSEIDQLCADLTAFVPGRVLDDDGSVLLRFANGAKGTLSASQVSVGEENSLRIRVYGELGGLEWRQEEPNTLWLKWADRPTEMVRTGAEYLAAASRAATRTPMGHPEGYLEAFANIYLAFAAQVRGQASILDCPGAEAALRGMAFIETVVHASQSEQKWHALTVG